MVDYAGECLYGADAHKTSIALLLNHIAILKIIDQQGGLLDIIAFF
jgi:hypothetical protein